jgi:PfaD family protein
MGAVPPSFDGEGLVAATQRIREPLFVVQDPHTGRRGIGLGGRIASEENGAATWPLVATLPPIYPEWLGDRSFCQAHGARFPYVAGAMANGIASVELVTAMARAGFVSFFGAAGLSLARITRSVDALMEALGPDAPWGSNLIHAPHEPTLEAATADLYIRRGVRRVSAAAYMALTPHIVRVSASGLRRDSSGRVLRRHRVFAKISRPEVARRFMEPAPAAMLDGLVAQGLLTASEAAIAATVPVAEDFTVESDSGGHTDNRPLTALFPTIVALRDQIVAERGYTEPIRLGAAGGLGTPAAVAAAFGLGASYVLTGSVNQGALESGLHEIGRKMLAGAGIADVIMAPAADMFELGVEVQVLQRGTMFAVRGRRLYELYRKHESLDQLSAADVAWLERDIFRKPIDQAWADTLAYWTERDTAQAEKAENDPHHRMALLFRAYLGQASRWAIQGQGDRRADYQIWCGPAMGAFNRWVQGSFLEAPESRSAVQIARNLLEGATVLTRAQQLRTAGLPVPGAAFDFRPRPLA